MKHTRKATPHTKAANPSLSEAPIPNGPKIVRKLRTELRFAVLGNAGSGWETQFEGSVDDYVDQAAFSAALYDAVRLNIGPEGIDSMIIIEGRLVNRNGALGPWTNMFTLELAMDGSLLEIADLLNSQSYAP